MFRRKPQPEAEPVVYMDHGLIQPFGELVRPDHNIAFGLNAVLRSTGVLQQVEEHRDIFGLVMGGYEGLYFGDDGTYTARVASELPLERWDGVQALENQVHAAVRGMYGIYAAEFVGFIDPEEARVTFDVELKRSLGLPFPAEVTWPSGGYHTGAPVTDSAI